jgi:hypothetical protein
MTVTSIPIPKKSREITVSYLGELLFNAGFIDDKQRARVGDNEFRISNDELRMDRAGEFFILPSKFELRNSS